VGLGLSNALVALCGALVAQNQGSADAGMGVGTIIAGLASVILGETLVGASTVPRACIAVIAGSILYRIAIALALSIHLGPWSLSPSDLNLVTAILVVLAMASPRLTRRRTA
jgi:putative ABC transport system permease protein